GEIAHGDGLRHVHLAHHRLDRRLEGLAIVVVTATPTRAALGAAPAGTATDVTTGLEPATALAGVGFARRRPTLGVLGSLVRRLGGTVQGAAGGLGRLGLRRCGLCGLGLLFLFGTQACLFFGASRVGRGTRGSLALLAGTQVGRLALEQRALAR